MMLEKEQLNELLKFDKEVLIKCFCKEFLFDYNLILRSLHDEYWRQLVKKSQRLQGRSQSLL